MFIRPDKHAIMQFSEEGNHDQWLCLPYGGKVRIDRIEEAFGGGGTNTAIGFARMGFDTYYVGKIGSQYGDKVIHNLDQAGVHTRYVSESHRDQTGFSTILSSYQGDRTVLAYSGANQLFDVDDLPLEDLATADFIFLNHLSKKNSKIPQALLKVLKANPSIKLAWNPGKEQIDQGAKKWKDLLRHTDILFLNKEEASAFSRKPFHLRGIRAGNENCPVHIPKSFLPAYADDVTEIILELLSYGVKHVVITDGKNGAQATDGKRLYFCPVVATNRLDSTGAGDAFSSGFSSAFVLGSGLKKALQFGTINAYHVINESGAQNGLLKREAMQKELKRLDICVTSTKLS